MTTEIAGAPSRRHKPPIRSRPKGHREDGSEICNGAGDVVDNAVPDDLRLPDYITIDATVFAPIVGPLGPGGGLNVSISRSGEVFVGPQGGAGAGGGGGIRAGWLDEEPGCDEDIDAFLDGDFVSYGFQAGLSGAKTISGNGSTSTEIGLSPSVEGSGVVGHSWNPFRLPFGW